MRGVRWLYFFEYCAEKWGLLEWLRRLTEALHVFSCRLLHTSPPCCASNGNREMAVLFSVPVICPSGLQYTHNCVRKRVPFSLASLDQAMLNFPLLGPLSVLPAQKSHSLSCNLRMRIRYFSSKARREVDKFTARLEGISISLNNGPCCKNYGSIAFMFSLKIDPCLRPILSFLNAD